MPVRWLSVSRQISRAHSDRKPFGCPSVNGELANSAVATGCSASDTRSFRTMSASSAKSRFTCTVQVRNIMSRPRCRPSACSAHDVVALLRHHRRLGQRPDRAESRARGSRCRAGRDHAVHCVEMGAQLRAGVVQRLQRRAGKLELAARLERDRPAAIGIEEADDVARRPMIGSQPMRASRPSRRRLMPRGPS